MRFLQSSVPLNHAPIVPATLPQLSITAAGYTITGTRHVINQDRYLVDQRRGVFMVADGMGGNRAGERAAHMAIESLPLHPALLDCADADGETVRRLIREAFLDVNQEILSAACFDSQLYGMGTTALLAIVAGPRLFLASVGDSRAYLLRDHDLQHYSTDHNMAQMLVNMGAISPEAARTHWWRHMLYKYLGAQDLKDGPDIAAIHLAPRDRILLVTDGVTEVLSSREMLTTLNLQSSASDAAEALVRAAVARGTRDDATSIVLDVDYATRV